MRTDPGEVVYSVSQGEAMDLVMVHDYMEAFGLGMDTTQRTQTFRHPTGAWALSIDTYSWGQVCVASNKYGQYITWIERGELPADLPDWAMSARAIYTSPQCLGHYDKGNVACDGNGTKINPVCVWRANCSKLQDRMGDSGNIPATLLVGYTTLDAVPPFCHGRTGAVPTPRALQQQRKLANREQLALARQVGTERAAARRQLLPREERRKRGAAPADPYVLVVSRGMALKLFELLAEALDRPWYQANKHRAVAGGMFYTDTFKKAGCYTLHRRMEDRPSSIPLAMLYAYPKKRQPGVRFSVIASAADGPALCELLQNRLPPEMNVHMWKDGIMAPTVVDVTSEGDLSTLVRVLARLAATGQWSRGAPALKQQGDQDAV